MRTKIDNTFGIEAEALAFVSYSSEAALREELVRIHEQYAGLPILHVGCCSNLLFLDDFEGIVLRSAIKGFRLTAETDDEVLVEVGSGEICDDFIAEAISACDVIEEVRGISLSDGQERTWKRADCGYGYRKSIFKEELWCKYAITRVTFRLSKHFVPKLQYVGLLKAVGQAGLSEGSITAAQLRQVIIDIRRAKLPDPSVLGNAGSFFKNPVVTTEKAGQLLSAFPDMPHYPAEGGGTKLAAGWLIEQAGWKGKSLGPAAVHDRQALVLVNKGGASGRDVMELCNAIRKDVADRFGIELEPEVNVIGSLLHRDQAIASSR